MTPDNPIRPIVRDGEEYYVVYVDSSMERDLHAQRAAGRAAETFAGRNWRRIKREMRRAYRVAIVEYNAAHPMWNRARTA